MLSKIYIKPTDYQIYIEYIENLIKQSKHMVEMSKSESYSTFTLSVYETYILLMNIEKNSSCTKYLNQQQLLNLNEIRLSISAINLLMAKPIKEGADWIPENILNSFNQSIQTLETSKEKFLNSIKNNVFKNLSNGKEKINSHLISLEEKSKKVISYLKPHWKSILVTIIFLLILGERIKSKLDKKQVN